jgi:ubiquitin-protein ligase
LQSNKKDGFNTFVIEQTPFDERQATNLPASNVIIGRILPRSNIYNLRAYKIEIALPSAYPFEPPIVRVLTPIYHPNPDKNGE